MTLWVGHVVQQRAVVFDCPFLGNICVPFIINFFYILARNILGSLIRLRPSIFFKTSNEIDSCDLHAAMRLVRKHIRKYSTVDVATERTPFSLTAFRYIFSHSTGVPIYMKHWKQSPLNQLRNANKPALAWYRHGVLLASSLNFGTISYSNTKPDVHLLRRSGSAVIIWVL